MDAGSLHHQNLNLPLLHGPPRRSDRIQARQALAQAIRTTIDNPTAKPYLLHSIDSDNTESQYELDSSNIFVGVSVPLPLHTILKVVPKSESALSSLREALNPKDIHAALLMELHNPISCLCN
ncbi:hypothetical protein DSO57_1001472 [Entomophthora muscae]|uniref:Uncharacterized protein n=1 Tax=Entomophthora muscae TaxID=34485 RepID=A0ACC2UJM1_9FUNG|nr:hypothetical protein DSO57_1001472 [Entomophthora muscae]